MTELEEIFLNALGEKTPNNKKAKALLKQGLDINATDSYGDSLLQQYLTIYSDYSPECDINEKDNCKGCEYKKESNVLSVIDFFIENGWDSVADGINCITILGYIMCDKQMFYAVKRILECPLSNHLQEFEDALGGIAAEESFQRCCEECHEQENLYFAMYELMDAKRKGKNLDGIHPFYDGVGKRVDKVVYFSDKNDLCETYRGTEYYHDLGFVCGDSLLVVICVNILFMNDRLSEPVQIDISDTFVDGIIGAIITDISFEHNNYPKDKSFGQPVIIIKFDSGREIRFTHNFGESPDKTQARYLIV